MMNRKRIVSMLTIMTILGILSGCTPEAAPEQPSDVCVETTENAEDLPLILSEEDQAPKDERESFSPVFPGDQGLTDPWGNPYSENPLSRTYQYLDQMEYRSGYQPKENKEPYERYGQYGPKETVRLSYVLDGDTVEIINSDGQKERLRLANIDTPELTYNKKKDLYGQTAKEQTKAYLSGDFSDLPLLLERDLTQEDPYGRTLGQLWLPKNREGTKYVMLSMLLLEDGYATIMKIQGAGNKYVPFFEVAETSAREMQLGVWNLNGYVTDDGYDPSVLD